MDMIICLDNTPEDKQDIASANCKGCGFTFYASKISLKALIHNKGALTCPSCQTCYQVKEVKLEGPLQGRKIAPASHPRTLVTDEVEIA